MHRDDCDRETITIGSISGWIESNHTQRKNGSLFAIKCGNRQRLPTGDVVNAYLDLLDVFDGLEYDGINPGTTRIEVRTRRNVTRKGDKKKPASAFEVARELVKLTNDAIAARQRRLAVG